MAAAASSSGRDGAARTYRSSSTQDISAASGEVGSGDLGGVRNATRVVFDDGPAADIDLACTGRPVAWKRPVARAVNQLTSVAIGCAVSTNTPVASTAVSAVNARNTMSRHRKTMAE